MIGRTRAGSLNFGRFRFFLRGLFGVSEAFEVNSNSSLNSHSGDGQVLNRAWVTLFTFTALSIIQGIYNTGRFKKGVLNLDK